MFNGNPIHVYRHRLDDRVLVAVILALFIIAPFSAGAMTGKVPLSVALPVLVVVAIFYTGLWKLLASYEIKIYSEGVEFQRLSKQIDISWADVAELRFNYLGAQLYEKFLGKYSDLIWFTGGFAVAGRSGGTSVPVAVSGPEQLTIVAIDGQTIRVNRNYKNASQAVRDVIGPVQNHLLPGMRSRLHSGEALPFGRLALCESAMMWKSTNVPMEDVVGFRLEGQRLYMTRQSKLFDHSVAIADVPNILPFLLLFCEIKEHAGSTGAAG